MIFLQLCVLDGWFLHESSETLYIYDGHSNETRPEIVLGREEVINIFPCDYDVLIHSPRLLLTHSLSCIDHGRLLCRAYSHKFYLNYPHIIRKYRHFLLITSITENSTYKLGLHVYVSTNFLYTF
jgi:hypothetical protein